VAGVILVHDLTRRRAAAGLATWAAELAAGASFAAAPPAPAAGSPAGALSARLRELGLPVPVRLLHSRGVVR
jgi:hypothetical protein